MLTQLEATAFYSLILGIVSLLSGFMGYSIMQTNQSLMSYLNAISTGVILAAAFTHLLPDAVEDLKGFEYPVAEACSLTGFLLLVIVETSMQYIQYEQEHKDAEEVHREHDCAEHNFSAGAPAIHRSPGMLRSSSIARVQKGVSFAGDNCRVKRGYSAAADSHDAIYINSASQYGSMALSTFDLGPANVQSHGHDHTDHASTEHAEHLEGYSSDQHSLLNGGQHGRIHGHGHAHGHHHGISSPEGMKITKTGAITLWAALMVHSTLEGFGVGVTSSVQQGAIVFAILIHKGFESLALNSALLEGKVSYASYLILYGIFCMSIPVGAMVGAALRSNGNSLFAGIITGLASGSFMYIGTMEMLPTTLSSCQNMIVAMMLFIGAAICMAALAGIV